MHRQPLLDLLADYEARHPDEVEVVQRYRAFVQEHSECFERSLLVGHVTGSAWIVDDSGERTLLTHHAKLNRWLQLGGHADGDPDVAAVALREAQEESGLKDFEFAQPGIFDIDIHSIPERKEVPEHFHYDLRFALQARHPERLVISEESIDLAWIRFDQLEEKTQEESMLRMRRKWLASLPG